MQKHIAQIGYFIHEGHSFVLYRHRSLFYIDDIPENRYN